MGEVTSRIVLFNGPKLSGKDTAIDYLDKCGIKFTRAECKESLHALTRSVFDVSERAYYQIYNNRKFKELPMDLFMIPLEGAERLAEVVPSILGRISENDDQVMLSIREALIYVSEVIIKPTLGVQYFGKSRVNTIEPNKSLLYVDSSCGFYHELPPLIDKLGQDNICLIRIRRPGHEFADDDSRSYIPDGVIMNTYDVNNNGSEEEFLEQVKLIVDDFIWQEEGW